MIAGPTGYTTVPWKLVKSTISVSPFNLRIPRQSPLRRVSVFLTQYRISHRELLDLINRYLQSCLTFQTKPFRADGVDFHEFLLHGTGIRAHFTKVITRAQQDGQVQ